MLTRRPVLQLQSLEHLHLVRGDHYKVGVLLVCYPAGSLLRDLVSDVMLESAKLLVLGNFNIPGVGVGVRLVVILLVLLLYFQYLVDVLILFIYLYCFIVLYKLP